MIDAESLLIQTIDTFSGNPHDSRNIVPLIRQAKQNFDFCPKEIVYDRAGRGENKIYDSEILTPSKPRKTDSIYNKQTLSKKLRRRAAIEPVIGHLKKYFRMGQNYLTGPRIHQK